MRLRKLFQFWTTVIWYSRVRSGGLQSEGDCCTVFADYCGVKKQRQALRKTRKQTDKDTCETYDGDWGPDIRVNAAVTAAAAE